MISLVCIFLEKSKLHINKYFAGTGLMLCVITHILRYEKYHSYSEHKKQVNNLIKMLFHGLSDDEIYFTLELFCTDYTDLDKKNGLLDGDEFICTSKDIRYGNSHLWHQKYSLPCTKVLGFLAYRVTSKVIGIGASERSWGDVKAIKSGIRYDISSDVLYKQSIVYTY